MKYLLILFPLLILAGCDKEPILVGEHGVFTCGDTTGLKFLKAFKDPTPPASWIFHAYQVKNHGKVEDVESAFERIGTDKPRPKEFEPNYVTTYYLVETTEDCQITYTDSIDKDGDRVGASLTKVK